jgi:periplasmic copper chaperone A
MKHYYFIATMIAIVVLASTSFAQEPTKLGNLVIEQPWSRASIGTSRPAAAYLTIRNKGKESDTLLAVRTPLSSKAEVHTTTKKGGVMSMGPAGPVHIPAGGKISLAPGGMHIMMMKLKAPLNKGGTVKITLTFKNAGKVTVTAPVFGPGATRPK